jgi:hypothetical protein
VEAIEELGVTPMVTAFAVRGRTILGPLPPPRDASCKAVAEGLTCRELYLGAFANQVECWGLPEGGDCSERETSTRCAPEFVCGNATDNAPTCRQCASAVGGDCQVDAQCSADGSVLCDLSGAGGATPGNCAAASNGATCLQDRCGPDFACVAQQCVDPPTGDDPCDSDSDCSLLEELCGDTCLTLPVRDQVCDGGCKGALLCSSTCGDRPTLNQPCSGVCQGPYICQNNVCEDPLSIEPLGVGDVCADEGCAGRQCEFEFGTCVNSYCEINVVPNVCTAYIPDTQACPNQIGCDPATSRCLDATCVEYDDSFCDNVEVLCARPGSVCRGTCEGGDDDGLPCANPNACEGGTCETACVPADDAPPLCVP